MDDYTTPIKQQSETVRIVAQDILRELQEQYRALKANSGMDLFYGLRDYITNKYLSEENSK